MSDRVSTSSNSKPNKFQLRREATHKELLRLGIERFPIKGYAATSISDIVDNSGLTRGAFYFHFESKEEFLLAVLRERATRRAGWWESAESDKVKSLTDAVDAANKAVANTMADGWSVWIPVMVEFSQAIRGTKELEAELHEIYLEWVKEMDEWIIRLSNRGWVRTDKTTGELAAAVFAFGEGVQIHHSVYKSDDAAALTRDGAVRILQP